MPDATRPQTPLGPITPLPNGQPFATHPFADQWLSEQGLSGGAQVRVTYQEVETIDSAAQTKTTLVLLRDAVTPGFLSAHQSQDIQPTGALSPRQGWVYPHISHMSLDFSSLRVNGLGLTAAHMQSLRAGIPSNYQGSGRAVVTGPAPQEPPLSPREAEQARQLAALDANEAKLARLFAGQPTFDNVIRNLLASNIKAKVPARKFRPSLFQSIDPEHWYVTRFTTDTNGVRSLTDSRRFIDVLWEGLVQDTPPSFPVDGVGFFTNAQTVDETASIFASPVDAAVLRVMESVFYVSPPLRNADLKRQFRADLLQFRNDTKFANLLDTAADATPPATAQAVFAGLLARRFLHFLQLYKVDRTPTSQLTQSARLVQYDEDRALELITTNPSQADRSRLLRTPIPQVFAVMLDMAGAPAQKWPAAMVIKPANYPVLFLYSMEGGLQRFRSAQALISTVRPLHEGQQRTIQSISSEIPGHVFEVAANDLQQVQDNALETALDAGVTEPPTLEALAKKTEEALALAPLSLTGALAARLHALIEHNRPTFYKTATPLEQQTYRVLEETVVQAVQTLGSGIQTLMQFTRGKLIQYLQKNVHPGIKPDPDKTLVTLTFGDSDNPRQTRTSSLTQLVLDNLRPECYPNAQRQVLAVYLADAQGRRVRNPSNGYLIILSGPELVKMTAAIDAGGSYETMLREETNKPTYKTAWQAAYLANMRFKAYEAALRGAEVFKTSVVDPAIDRSRSQKLLALWLDVLMERSDRLVRGQSVRLYGLVLGGAAGAGGAHGTLRRSNSVNGALVFTDQEGPEINATVGVYFPDSPDGQDFHEFSNLSDGVAGLLGEEKWKTYFRSRLSTAEPEDFRSIFERSTRPLIRATLIAGDFIEVLYREHVAFQSAYADHRSNSNRDVQRQTTARLILLGLEIAMEIGGLLLSPGIVTYLKAVARTGAMITRTGAVPKNLNTLIHLHRIANISEQTIEQTIARFGTARGRASFLALTGRRQGQGDVLPGLPLEEAVYQRYAGPIPQ